MLVLTCYVGEDILIGPDIRVRITEKRGAKSFRLGVDAPREVTITHVKLPKEHRRRQPPRKD